jgi:molybdopterin synthase sulfur carrier subunit
VHWKLFADLRERAGADEVDVGDADTVGEALDALLDGEDALRERVLDDDGSVVDDVNVLLNGTNVFETGDGLEEPVNEDDELALFPPVSGG